MGRVILAGDVGGTKTHLALFDIGENRRFLIDAKFKSQDYPSLFSILDEFLKVHSHYQVNRACFGVAGPVKDRKCKATNLPWIIDADLLEEKMEISPISLINDLEANAYGIDCLKEEEFYLLNKGVKQKGNAALISAGTGLGEAGFFWDGKQHHPFACEGGHCSFSPESELEMQLLSYLHKQYDHVSFERILSGPGIYQLYRFIIDEGIEEENTKVERDFGKEDRSKVITQMAMEGSDKACAVALDLFVSIYGSESANLSLKLMATGGLYIGGGIAPKILHQLSGGRFMKRFIQKGRFAPLLIDIPVKVVLNENTALLGAGRYAQKNSGT